MSVNAQPRLAPVVSRPLRIEMILPTLYAGGMETVVARLTRALARRNHEVGVTVTEWRGVLADELQREGVRVSLVPAPGLRSNVRATELCEHLRRIKPDVVHAHSGIWLKAVRASRRAGIDRVVCTMHGIGIPRWYDVPLQYMAARYTTQIVCVSEALRHRLVGARVAPHSTAVIPNGVDTQLFRPRPHTQVVRGPLGIDERQPVIGIVARLELVKNHALLITAFARLRQQFPNAALVLVGVGLLRQVLEELTAQLGLNGHVHWLGERRDVHLVYPDFDVFVLPSNDEGAPMSLLEAMSCGIGTVATSVGGIPVILDAGRCGRLVPPGDVAALADAIAIALTDRAETQKRATAARERVVEAYSEEAMLRSYERIYSGASPLQDEVRRTLGVCAD